MATQTIEDKLALIHSMALDEQIRWLERGECSPREMAVVIQTLKNNGWTADLNTNKKLDDLATALLPEIEDLNDIDYGAPLQ